MFSPRQLGSLLSTVALTVSIGVVAGCAGSASDPSGSSADDLTTASAIRVSGVTADRLLNAFDLANAADHAMGGRAGVDVKSLQVLTAANSALDNDDPNFLVPSTSAVFDDANEQPSHREITDPAAVAAVLYDALAAVSEKLGDAAMGQTFMTAARVQCEGRGPGAGSDPANPPETVASCKIKSDDGNAYSVDGEKALRIVQAFGLVSEDAVDHAMGGDFGVDATNVTCSRSGNEMLDEDNPLFEVPVSACKGTITDAKPFDVQDKPPVAVALQKALELAGLQADSAMGKTGVTSAHVTCLKGPDAPTSCTLAPN